MTAVKTKQTTGAWFRYVIWNGITSYLLFWWWFTSFLYQFVAGAVPPLDATWSNFLAWVGNLLSNFGILYLGCFPTGVFGMLLGWAIAGYNPFKEKNGMYGAVYLILGNFIFTLFVFLGLFPILIALGWFWAIVIYGILKAITTGWVELQSLRASVATRRGLTHLSERIAGGKR